MPDPTPSYHVPKTRTYIPKKVSPEEMSESQASTPPSHRFLALSFALS